MTLASWCAAAEHGSAGGEEFVEAGARCFSGERRITGEKTPNFNYALLPADASAQHAAIAATVFCQPRLKKVWQGRG
jgi:hypothetical protein